MTISKDLFLAIVSMDSYNRGYGSGVGSDEDGLGSRGGTKIGTATVFKNLKDADLDDQAEDIGFYAIAYMIGSGVDGLASGTKVISYRGTNADNASNFVSDALNGYGAAPTAAFQ
jgi:hypothetical protein